MLDNQNSWHTCKVARQATRILDNIIVQLFCTISTPPLDNLKKKSTQYSFQTINNIDWNVKY